MSFMSHMDNLTASDLTIGLVTRREYERRKAIKNEERST